MSLKAQPEQASYAGTQPMSPEAKPKQASYASYANKQHMHPKAQPQGGRGLTTIKEPKHEPQI